MNKLKQYSSCYVFEISLNCTPKQISCQENINSKNETTIRVLRNATNNCSCVTHYLLITFILCLFSGMHLEILEDMDPILKQGCKLDAYIKEECLQKNLTLCEKN